MDYRNCTTQELYDKRTLLKEPMRHLEKRGALRTTSENEHLKLLRAMKRAINRELAQRQIQLPLFGGK